MIVIIVFFGGIIMNDSNERFSPIEPDPILPDEDLLNEAVFDEPEDFDEEEELLTDEETTDEALRAQLRLVPKEPKTRLDRTLHRLPMLLSFALPFLIACIAFTVSMLTTGGKNMLLSSDGWHQYYPFLVTLRDKLLSGGSLEYSWVVGMGGNFTSLYAYYLASPMYLLTVLVPLDLLPSYFTLMTVLKLSFAGLFFGWFLRLVYRQNDLKIPVFALAYAFCAWAAGYYWNIMWLDTFALLPLLVASTVCLLRDGKFRMYVIVLAFSLWCNYYVAFFCCIFVLLCFIGYCICCRNGWKNFLLRFLRIGVCTLLGAGIASILLIPTLLAMQTTYSSTVSDFYFFRLNVVDGLYGSLLRHDTIWNMLKSETIGGIFTAVRMVLSGLMPATIPTDMEGLPNVFCSLTAVMLSIYYFCCKKISKREKIFNLCLLAFIMLSFILRILDYIWHGFHFPNMLPYRFSFLFSFVVIAMAYRACMLLEDIKLRHVFIIALTTVLLILNAYLLNGMGTLQLVATAAVFLGVLACLIFYFFTTKSRKPKTHRALTRWKMRKFSVIIALCIAISLEMLLSLGCGINAIGFTSQYNDDGSVVYPRKDENVQALLNYLDQKDDDPLFYRTEVTNTQTLNDPALNNYYGVSIFNSSANANFNRLTRSLGLASWVGSNRFIYYESSPFTNTMCGIKYLIDRTGSHYNKDYNVLLASSDSVNLLENTAFVSIGFMAESTLADFVAESAAYNPINEQEQMFRLATGIEDELYEHLTAEEFEKPFGGSVRATGTSGTQYSYTTVESASEKQDVGIVFTIEEDGLYVATTKRPVDADSKVKVYCNNKLLFSLDIKVRLLFSVGSFKKGDQIKFVYSVPSGEDGNISLDLAKQNNAVFDAGLATLSDEPLEITEFSDGYVKGTIDVLSDGLFYTSIPYEPGWSAYVDGNEVALAEGYDVQNETVSLTDAVISFPLTAGQHEIELVYHAPGLNVGAIVCIVCLLCFVALCILLRKNPVLWPDRDYTPREERIDKKRAVILGVSALVASVVTADLLWVIGKGAVSGYHAVWEKPVALMGRLLSFMEKYDDDAVFFVLLAAACVVIPLVLTLWCRFVRCLRILIRSRKPNAEESAPENEESECTEIENRGDEVEQEPATQEDQGTEASSD